MFALKKCPVFAVREEVRKLYLEYQDQVFRFAFKNLKSQALAQDVVQEVFLALCSKNFDSISNIRSYIFQVTKNKLVDIIRETARSRKQREKMWEVIAGEQQAIDSRMIEKEYFESFIKAKSLLTPKQKQIFELSRKEGLSHKKIAEKLNLSQNTVKNHIVASLKTIKEYLLVNSDLYTIVFIFQLFVDIH